MVSKHLDTVSATFRSLKILSPLNEKGVKAETQGYLQAMLYMAPHTLAGGKTVCPHSTPACREGCLYTAGRGKTPRVQGARLRRTRMFLADREAFLLALIDELDRMQRGAWLNGLKLAIRLNGTSDIRWELEALHGQTIFERFPHATFFDYTRIPAWHRETPANWRLTHSLADQDAGYALAHLAMGRNVAAIVPDEDRLSAPSWFALGSTAVMTVDGEKHDLRFLDPTPALILLKPKGRLAMAAYRSPMVHRGLIKDILAAWNKAA